MNTSRKFARWSQLAALVTTALFVFVLLAPSTALAAYCTSAQSGNWNDNAT